MSLANTDLERLQAELMDYLRHNNTDVFSRIEAAGSVTIETRLNIYKNAYRIRLRETIDNDHPLLGIYLGDELFQEMADAYIDTFPSKQVSLRHYADDLPVLLKRTEPFCHHPILAELAAFERLLLTSFDAANSPRLAQSDLQELAPEYWPGKVFKLHSSVQLFYSDWNSVESWQALKQECAPEAAREKKGAWLVWRNPERLTEFRPLDEEELALLQQLVLGHSFEQLCLVLAARNPGQDVTELASNYLKNWLQAGLIRK